MLEQNGLPPREKWSGRSVWRPNSGGKAGVGREELKTLGVLIFLLGHLLSGLAGQGWHEGSEAKKIVLSSFWTSHFLTPLFRDFRLQTVMEMKL